MRKKYLHELLFEKGYAPSISDAKKLIMAHLVFVNGQRGEIGVKYQDDFQISVKQKSKYKSRGGYKLEKAIDVFNISLNKKIALDIGASTGGFTDCMLQNGASFVYAVDVGYGQFNWELRNSPQVQLFEKTNIRYMKFSDFSQAIDFVAMDVSFISVKKIFPIIQQICKREVEVISLIKPQFEIESKLIPKGGVIADKNLHIQILNNIMNNARDLGFQILQLDYSPIKGQKGNIEFLLHMKNSMKSSLLPNVHSVVNKAWSAFEVK